MTGQNTSTAVMQQRREPRDAVNDFPTHPYAVRALVEDTLAPLLGGGDPDRGLARLAGMAVAEPACNRGFMARVLGEYFRAVAASDIVDYGYIPGGIADFLADGTLFATETEPVDFVITNPPFVRALQFIERALEISRTGVAMFVRSAFLEGGERYEQLFSVRPPTVIAQHVDRVPLVEHRLDPEIGSATAYLWLVWIHGMDPLPFHWIAPARNRFTRPGDYDLPPNRNATYCGDLLGRDGKLWPAVIAAPSVDDAMKLFGGCILPAGPFALAPVTAQQEIMVAMQRVGRLWVPDPDVEPAKRTGADWRTLEGARLQEWGV